MKVSKLLLVLSVAIGIGKGLYSQTPFTPTIIPPSPNAASLGKFGDVPVSPYTGTTDVSIPIYTLQAKGVSVPVTLAYHTGGIRLSEESGWSGLGWALSAGGMISRSINGKDDFVGPYFTSDFIVGNAMPDIKGRLVQHPFYPPFMLPMGVWGYDFVCRYKVYTQTDTIDLFNPFKSEFSSPGYYDLEPDSYSFNFLGRSGKFIIDRSKKVILQKQENLKIAFASDASSFTITDEQGNQYLFQDKEYNKPTIGGAQHISSWLLSKIITQQKDSVMFNYTNDNTWTTVKGNNTETIRTGGSSSNTAIIGNDPGQDYMNKTLQSIDYSNAQVQFNFDGLRSDVQGGKKLNTVKIYSKDAGGNLKYVKEQQLFYSYFVPQGTADTLEFYRLRLDSVREASGSTILPAYSFNYNLPSFTSILKKHSPSVDHWGYYNGIANSGFTPAFIGNFFIGPPLAVHDQYLELTGANREPNDNYMKTFSLSSVTYPTGGSTAIDYDANYYDYANSKAGSDGRDFEQVTTIDKTQQFIINTNGTTNGTIDFSHIYLTIPNGVGSNGTLSIAFRAASSDSLNKYHNTFSFGKINFTFQSTTDIITSNLQCNGTMNNGNCSGTVYSTGFPITISSPSVMNWSAYIDPSVKVPGGLQDIVVTFTWKEALFNNTTQLMAGGLRVKTITDYSAPGKIAKQRNYDYGYQQDRNNDGTPENYSFGRLMGYLSYGRYEPTGDNGINYVRYSSSYTSFTSQTSGNIVGYDQVTEYTTDPQTLADNGKTVYSFYNSSDTTFTYGGYRFPGVTNLGNALNGLPKSKSVFANAGTGFRRISSSDYFYHSTNRTIYSALKYWHPSFSTKNQPGAISNCPASPPAPPCGCPLGIDSAGYDALANFYPAISSEVVLLDSTIEKTYDQNDTTIQYATVTRNNYDNPKHFQLTRSSVNDSKNNTLVSYLRYPQDYLTGTNTQTGNTIIDSMINKNMVASTIEKRDSLYYAGSSTGYIKGAQLNTFKLLSNQSIAADKIFKLDIAAPVTSFSGFSFTGNSSSQDSRYRQMISFDSYDNLNNILQYTGTDQTSMSYIWDYKQMYPVAQVKNAVQSDIAYTSFEADGTGNWTIASSLRDNSNAVTGNQSYNLSNGAISKGSLTNGKKYVLAYWSMYGPKPIAGATQTTKTGRTVNGWTYYEHTLTMTSTSLSVSGTGLIDELRLYPLGALMTSYNYEPLVGLTATGDPNSENTFYEYDALTRLKNIKDYQGNIIKNFRYNYAAGSCGNNCYILPMQTTNGSNTLGYPVGVFSVNKQLLGNATTQAQYVSIWNGNAANQAVGVLSAGADPLKFNLQLNTGQAVPFAVIGLRYYQFDLSYTNLDAVRVTNGEYVDFGDGNKLQLGSSFSADALPGNTTANYFSGSTNPYIIHTYPDTTQKTITFYHNDVQEVQGLDNFNNPATSLTKIKNLRGNYPQYTTGLNGSSYQQASAHTVANITNWSTISSATNFSWGMGDGVNPNTNMNFAQDFYANNKGLKRIFTSYGGYYLAGYRDSTFKISRLKSDWNTYFTNLETISISDEHWNRENISSLAKLSSFTLVAGTLHHTNNSSTDSPVAIPVSVLDNVIIQIAAGAGQNISNGQIFLITGGTTRSSASDAAYNQLLANGWTISISW